MVWLDWKKTYPKSAKIWTTVTLLFACHKKSASCLCDMSREDWIDDDWECYTVNMYRIIDMYVCMYRQIYIYISICIYVYVYVYWVRRKPLYALIKHPKCFLFFYSWPLKTTPEGPLLDVAFMTKNQGLWKKATAGNASFHWPSQTPRWSSDLSAAAVSKCADPEFLSKKLLVAKTCNKIHD